MKQITQSEFSELEQKVMDSLTDRVSKNVSRATVFAILLTVNVAFEDLKTKLFDIDDSIEIITDKEQ